jgi:Bacteriocin-protection, YdeI or OmpD-Associated/Domain of unknown function (DUF1905)
MPITFSTHLSGQIGKPTGIEVPPKIIAALGTAKTPAVQVSLSGYSYRSKVGVMGGKFMIPVSAAHREAAGLTAGDALEVSLELDLEPRTTEVPADLAVALAAAGTGEMFAALAPSKRKEHVRQVEDARTPETRERRIAKIVALLASE